MFLLVMHAGKRDWVLWFAKKSGQRTGAGLDFLNLATVLQAGQNDGNLCGIDTESFANEEVRDV